MTQQLSSAIRCRLTYLIPSSNEDTRPQNIYWWHVAILIHTFVSNMILLTLALQLTSRAANQSGRLTLRGVSYYPHVLFHIAHFTGHSSENYDCLTLPLTLELRSTTDTITLASQLVIQTSSLLFLLSQEINTTQGTADLAVSGSCEIRELIGQNSWQ